ncbi:hypothetical protein ACIRN4_12440 [Pimelobacter simplex]|uniref:hypothetical protein n=1 Tax=Nocardioides simplex TaxID=2045 RepID=UPI0037F21570
MIKRPRRLRALVAAAATGIAVMSTMTGAQAATLYLPSGGPAMNLVASYDDPRTPESTVVPGVQLTLVYADESIDCAGLSFGGSLVSPGTVRAFGSPMAELGAVDAPGCSNPTYGATTLDLQSTPRFAISGDATGGTWPAKITNVRWKIAWPSCDFTIEGTIVGRLDAATQVFTPVGNPGTGPSYTASGLAIAANPAPVGAACATLDLQPGDEVGVRGTFLNTPPAGSTGVVLPTSVPTYTPSGGPAVALAGSYDDPRVPGTAIGPGIALSLIEPAQSIYCSGFSLGGSANSPGTSRSLGMPAAGLGVLAAPGCVNPLLGPMTFTSVNPSNLVLTGSPVAGKWPAQIAGVRWKVTGHLCEFYLEGAIDGTFDTVAQVFTPVGNPGPGTWTSVPSGLRIAGTPAPPTGGTCRTVDLLPGDQVGIRGTFTNTPPAGSTPLALSTP